MDDGYARIVQRLGAETEAIVIRAMAAIRADLSDYVIIPDAELRASVWQNVRRSLQCMAAGAAPDANEIAEPQSTTRRRMEQGLPIDTIIRGYRVNLNVIHHRFIELAREIELEPSATLAGSTLLWEVGDWFMNNAIREYRTHTVPDQIRRNVEKAVLVRALTETPEPDAGLLARAHEFGLHEGASHRVIVVGSATLSAAELVLAVEQYGAERGRGAVAAVLPDGVTGIVSRDPVELVGDAAIAAGPWTPLVRIAQSASAARRVAAACGGAPGWHDEASTSWRIAVQNEPEVTRLLAAKYLDSLEAGPAFGRILLETVWAYLDHDRSIRRTAASLVVHENTLRHRLERFEALTGARLTDLNTLVELAWLRAAGVADRIAQPLS